LAAGSGVLIGDRVFLTAAHVTRPSEDGIPPFIHVYVTFNLHVFDDRSTWIPVVDQAWHPSTPPCHNNVCNWDFPPLSMSFSDVGLMLLESPPRGIKPMGLAHALPEEQREAFVAHELEGRSFKEIVAETGVSVNTLLSRKRYAVLRLRERLQSIYDEFTKA
jgi:hypothetical protein